MRSADGVIQLSAGTAAEHPTILGRGTEQGTERSKTAPPGIAWGVDEGEPRMRSLVFGVMV